MSLITILTRTLIVASIVAVIGNILVINSSATLGEKVSQLETDQRVLVRINDELTNELGSLYDIKRIADEAGKMGFVSANTAMTIILPDPLAMQP